jgi:hypothetical protein
MFWKKKGQVPWDEVGAELGKCLVERADGMSQVFKKGLKDNLNEPGMPDFDGVRWRYEMCIYQMFWTWELANTPKLREAGATKPWLDSFHKSAYLSMAKAGLVGTEKSEEVQAWERDCEERLLAYQQVLHNPSPPPTFYTGSLGWVFMRFVFPEEKPNPHLVPLLTIAGHEEFIALSKMIKSLEDTYSKK